MFPLYLPYYQQPSWEIPLPFGIDPLEIHAFGILVALALVVGTWVCRWHGEKVGQHPTVVVDAATWTCISGFIVGHLVSVIFYFPERIIEDPLQLVMVWNGLSSFGGFFGAALGLYLFLKKRGLPLLPYYETIAVGLGPGWILGRLGCTVAHDHPGRETDFFLAFDHPNRGPIHDLGFYEFLFAICITIIVFIVRRFKWPAGSIPAVMAMVYAPVRFMFDFLRIQDVKYSPVLYYLEKTGAELPEAAPWWYLNFTPGQWFSVALFGLGVAVMVVAWRGRGHDENSKGAAASGDERESSEDVEKSSEKASESSDDGEESSDDVEKSSDDGEESSDERSADLGKKENRKPRKKGKRRR